MSLKHAVVLLTGVLTVGCLVGAGQVKDRRFAARAFDAAGHRQAWDDFDVRNRRVHGHREQTYVFANARLNLSNHSEGGIQAVTLTLTPPLPHAQALRLAGALLGDHDWPPRIAYRLDRPVRKGRDLIYHRSDVPAENSSLTLRFDARGLCFRIEYEEGC